MFDVIEGFQSKGVKEVSLKHAKEFSKWVILISIGILIGRLCFSSQKLFAFTADNFGMLLGITLFCLVDYLRDIVKLGPESKNSTVK